MPIPGEVGVARPKAFAIFDTPFGCLYQRQRHEPMNAEYFCAPQVPAHLEQSTYPLVVEGGRTWTDSTAPCILEMYHCPRKFPLLLLSTYRIPHGHLPQDMHYGGAAADTPLLSPPAIPSYSCSRFAPEIRVGTIGASAISQYASAVRVAMAPWAGCPWWVISVCKALLP